jgi:hypothetical protein
MSAGIMPDVYRHTARKSTVSKMIKPSNVPVCSTVATPYATYHHDNEKKQETIFDAIECTIKLEEDIPASLPETFVLVPDNETEQLLVKEDQDQRNTEAAGDIIEQILNQIALSAVETTPMTVTQVRQENVGRYVTMIGCCLDTENAITRHSGCSRCSEFNNRPM